MTRQDKYDGFSIQPKYSRKHSDKHSLYVREEVIIIIIIFCLLSVASDQSLVCPVHMDRWTVRVETAADDARDRDAKVLAAEATQQDDWKVWQIKTRTAADRLGVQWSPLQKDGGEPRAFLIQRRVPHGIGPVLQLGRRGSTFRCSSTSEAPTLVGSEERPSSLRDARRIRCRRCNEDYDCG